MKDAAPICKPRRMLGGRVDPRARRGAAMIPASVLPVSLPARQFDRRSAALRPVKH